MARHGIQVSVEAPNIGEGIKARYTKVFGI